MSFDSAASANLVTPLAEREGVSVPTLNRFGWASTKFLAPVPQFIEDAAASPHWSLDIGCAYGIYTLAAIESGARVVANDIDERHLAIVRSAVPPELAARLQTVCGAFPSVELPSNHFGVILANRVLHFLDGEMLEVAAAKIFDILVPGGVAYVRTITPYMSTQLSFIPVYEKRKAAGERYPGFVPDFTEYVSDPREREVMSGQIHMIEPEILARTFAEAGFVIQKSEFCSAMIEPYKLDGRETALVAVRKPI